MSRKFLVLGLIIGLLIGLLIGYFLPSILSNSSGFSEITNPKISMKITGMTIHVTGEYYVLRVDANLPDDITTLYNCIMEVDYLTENNVWKATSENIGIVNYGQYVRPQVELDADFKIGDPSLVPYAHYYQYDGTNVEVHVFGYAKP